MEQGDVNVLLIGESERSCWQMARHLEQRGCRWWFASTIKEVQSLLDERGFRLVLSTRPVTQGSRLLELFSGFDSSVFYSYPIEDSCLWFQAAPDGRDCRRMSAFRPSEFMSVLDQIIAGMQRDVKARRFLC
jgi:hypothetical protein